MFIPHGQNLARGESNIEHILLFVFWFSVSRVRFKPRSAIEFLETALYKLVLLLLLLLLFLL